MSEFFGLPDDIARLAIQRLLECDIRSRSHRKASNYWQKISISLAVAAVIASSVAAVVASKNMDPRAIIALSIFAAIMSATQAALNANDRMEKHRSAATTYESLANDLDRFMNLELGPVMWRGLVDKITHLQKPLDEIDTKIKLAASTAPPVKLSNSSINASKLRGARVIEYLEMGSNVSIPPDEIWTS